MTKRVKILIIVLFVAVFTILKTCIDRQNEQIRNSAYTVQQQDYFNEIDNALKKVVKFTDIKINLPEDYNYKTKAGIFDIRKKYVKNSIFATENYTPSNEVYGQIENGKPWYGLQYYRCAGNAKKTNAITVGVSEESRFINNPSYLVGIDCGTYTLQDSSDYQQTAFCTDKKFVPYPTSITYNPDKKTIIAVVSASGRQICTFNDTNARDLGYNFGHVSKIKNAKFISPINPSNALYEFRNYIQNENSCELKGGCNNSVPYVRETEMIIDESQTAQLNFKLWHKRPDKYSDEADLNYTLIIKTY